MQFRETGDRSRCPNGLALAHRTSHDPLYLHHSSIPTYRLCGPPQRVEHGLDTSTTSAWSVLSAYSNEFINPHYSPDATILTPNLSASALRPWIAYYCRGPDLLLNDPLTLFEARYAALAIEHAKLQLKLEAARELPPAIETLSPPAQPLPSPEMLNKRGLPDEDEMLTHAEVRNGTPREVAEERGGRVWQGVAEAEWSRCADAKSSRMEEGIPAAAMPQAAVK